MKKLLDFFVITSFTITTIILFNTNTINFYIHPRYNNLSIFAIVGCLIAVFLYIIHEIFIKKKETKYDLKIILFFLSISILFYNINLGLISILLSILIPLKGKFTKVFKSVPISYVICISIAVASLILEPKVLSPRAASQRAQVETQSNSAPTDQVFLNFASDSEKLDIGNWLQSLAANPDLSDYTGKKINIKGFVYKSENLNSDSFMLARFRLSCCVVDATPVGFPVLLENWESTYAQGTWLSIQGEFIQINVNGNLELGVKPISLEKIDQPDNPYLF